MAKHFDADIKEGGQSYNASVPDKKLGKPKKIFSASKDIADQKVVQERYQEILEATPDAIVMTNKKGKIVFVNTQTEKLFGYKKNELLGKKVEILIPKPYRKRHPHHREQYFKSPHIRPMGIGMELYGLRKNGEKFPVEISLSPFETGENQMALAAVRDITDRKYFEQKLTRLNQQLTELIVRDPLTGLFNRRYLEESLRHEIHRAKRKKTQIAVFMMDIDHFKKINDEFGHIKGDIVLRLVSKCFERDLRQGDIICRYGGEEFVAILPEISTDTALSRAKKLRKEIKNLINTHNKAIPKKITISIGVAFFPQHGQSVKSLIKAADLALYLAKHQGRDKVVMVL